MFYNFRQNNSGGVFIVDDTVTVNVFIEAEGAHEANFRAENIGIYFDGCELGDDCPCCGDRWYRAYKDDGETEPTLYGAPIADRYTHGGLSDMVWVRKGDPDVIVHYLDGRIEKFYPPDNMFER